MFGKYTYRRIKSINIFSNVCKLLNDPKERMASPLE